MLLICICNVVLLYKNVKTTLQEVGLVGNLVGTPNNRRLRFRLTLEVLSSHVGNTGSFTQSLQHAHRYDEWKQTKDRRARATVAPVCHALPAKAATQGFYIWIPAFAGMTGNENSFPSRLKVDIFLEPLAFKARKESILSGEQAVSI